MSKSPSDKYKKLDQREHVLKRPDMYIGSVRSDKVVTFVVDGNSSMTKKEISSYIPGLFKIFDEIVANAIDHAIRQQKTKTRKVKEIRVTIDKKTGEITVYNDGEGIETVKHSDHGIYIPELLFGNLLTSSNYNDDEMRDVQGTNGIGCKACNIMSEYFKVETLHSASKKLYTQVFENNMKVVNPPKLEASKESPHTKITFKPDYSRFGVPKGLPTEMFEVMKKRVYDTCAFLSDKTEVYFNDKKIPYSGFKSYVQLYISDDTPVFFDTLCDGSWEVAIASNTVTNSFEQVSFVNGLNTIMGGKHVDHVVDQLIKKVKASLKKVDTNAIKPALIKDNIMVFVKCTVPNPTFNSQSKEILTTPAKAFGCNPELSASMLNKIIKSEIFTNIQDQISINIEKSLKKTDGKKSKKIRNMPKLDDASWAGTSKSKECTLILTEGDSAASMALSGLSSADRDRFGVFPLKGKVMNVKDASVKKIMENEEITNIKKILGLESGKEYTNTNDLRYGKIMLMTDSDDDGHHIKGLIFNLFYSLFPTLVKNKSHEFITSMLTPIIKAKKNAAVKNFYNLVTYEKWVRETPDAHTWKIKYYKGLGTSTNQEAKEYFREMNVVTYDFSKASCPTSLNLAFDKKFADKRKDWLSKYDKDNILDTDNKVVDCHDFINKELIHFSKYDLERSIPNICDGLKISQRKIMFSCFKRNLYKDELRVAQLAGYVSEQSAYHHGEASLQAAIVNMAQTFVGSNNINLLMPNGQFGSRVHGGKDAGQPRYIHTQLSPIVENLFIKADNQILNYLDDDGLQVEPQYYIPIIPMALVNGAIGIGTGFSTNIPCHNPVDIINYYLNKLDSKTTTTPAPYYNGFKGKIEKSGATKYISRGVWRRSSVTSVHITELPVGVWTIDYKSDLEELLEKHSKVFKSYDNRSAEDIDITLHFTSKDALDSILNDTEAFEKMFKLTSYRGLLISNMYLFNENGQITKYKSVKDVLDSFYKIRMTAYASRKEKQIASIEEDLEILKNKVKFVSAVVLKQISVYEITKKQLEDMLAKQKYYKKDDTGYDYLVKIPIYNFTLDKVKELKKELADKQGQLEGIKKTTTETVWKEELTALRNKIGGSNEKAAPKKAAPKKAVKTKGGYMTDSDSDSESEPAVSDHVTDSDPVPDYDSDDN